MRIKTQDLIGVALDWAVEIAEGRNFIHGDTEYTPDGRMFQRGGSSVCRSPSTQWKHGGPIIDREKISINYDASGRWSDGWRAFSNIMPIKLGPTALIAAMRCFVESRMGNWIDVPDELFETA